MLHSPTRSLLALLAVLLTPFAVPAVAAAQGAGDQQYADPFTDDGSQGGGGSDSDAPDSDAGSGGDAGTGTASPGTQETPATTQPTTQSSASPQADTSQTGEELPRTGYSAWLVALAGGVLLASGTTVRLSLGRLA